MPINDLYTEVVAEHSRSPRHRHKLEGATAVMRGVNPSCGDDITLELREENGIIQDAAFTGVGCAISQASADMMIDVIKGKTANEAMQLAQLFFDMIKGEATTEEQLEPLEDAMALQGVSHMPARVKCAVLAWHTLKDICDKEE
ncbi:MAG: Fe-S cluster assembly sulfur transfer protein SufU [Oscillospiraceae bacterium]